MQYALHTQLSMLVALVLTTPGRCLGGPGPSGAPQDAPPVEAPPKGLITRTPGASPGFTLLAPLKSTTTYLLDMQGEVAHSWKSTLSPGNAAYLLEDGSLLRCGRVDNERFHGGGQGGRIQRISWDGELLWDYSLSDDAGLAHHDIAPMPNGHVLVIAWEFVGPDELLAAGRRPSAVTEDGLWPDYVVELAPRPTADDLGGAEVVWEWHAFDHLIQDENEGAANFGVVANAPQRIDVNALLEAGASTEEELERAAELEEQMRALGYVGDDPDEEEDSADARDRGRRGGPDWLHTNSIDYLPGEDLILLSPRRMSEIWVLDHSTTTAEAATGEGGRRGRGGDLLWRFGNPAAHGGAGERVLFAQHDARWVRDAEPLRVMVFNNGEGRPADEPYSTVEVLELPDLEAPGHAADAAPVRLRTIGDEPGGPTFFSSFISGAQDLPGGNVLICSGAEARLLEVDPAGAVVWEWRDDLPAEPGADRPRRRGDGPPPGAGGPPRGRRGDRPRAEGGPPRGEPGPGGPGGHDGHGGRAGFFRATRYGVDFAGLARLRAAKKDASDS